MEKINVLIVDDSAFMRKLITDFLSEDERLHVIGTARNGEEAIKKVKTLKPDVITLDIEMPVLNGLDALKRIMKEHPVPVVMLSSTTHEGAENTIQSFQLGAVDFVPKPSGPISLDLHKIKNELIQKVLLASKANVAQLTCEDFTRKTTTTDKIKYSKIDRKESPLSFQSRKCPKKKIVCIGTSTGGPRALQQVITKLPKELDAPIFVVQHMPPGFTKSLANRLDSLSELKVKEAENGELVENGTVYIAPGGFHLKVRETSGNRLRILLDDVEPPKAGHRPSVDVLFFSLSNLVHYKKIAVIMTGMGSDGAEGLKKLKESGNTKAIAESKETSIVYGMPKAAIATNCVDEVQNVEYIADTIVKYLS